MSKHTPGPWTWEGITQTATGRGYYAISTDGREVAAVGRCTPHDARLIAAAPELLAALEELAAFADLCNTALVSSGEHVAGPCPYVDRARQAIAKAEGGDA